jgi:hypothetical protein
MKRMVGWLTPRPAQPWAVGRGGGIGRSRLTGDVNPSRRHDLSQTRGTADAATRDRDEGSPATLLNRRVQYAHCFTAMGADTHAPPLVRAVGLTRSF